MVIHVAQLVVHVFFRAIFVLNVFFYELVIRLWRYKQSVGLVLLVLVHLLASDVGTFLQHNPDQMFQTKHIASI